MGLGSQNKQSRKEFISVAKTNWKSRIKTVEDARHLIFLLKKSSIVDDTYTERKIKDLEGYIEWVETNSTGSADVHCENCAAKLYEDDVTSITFLQYIGLPCPGKCKASYCPAIP